MTGSRIVAVWSSSWQWFDQPEEPPHFEKSLRKQKLTTQGNIPTTNGPTTSNFDVFNKVTKQTNRTDFILNSADTFRASCIFSRLLDPSNSHSTLTVFFNQQAPDLNLRFG
jgi:hypothetical protein